MHDEYIIGTVSAIRADAFYLKCNNAQMLTYDWIIYAKPTDLRNYAEYWDNHVVKIDSVN